MPYTEIRGNSIRVKWWNGQYRLDTDGRPTRRKVYESASGPEDGVPFASEDEAYNFGLDRESDVRNGRHIKRSDGKMLMADLCPAWLGLQDLAYDSIRAYRTAINAKILPHWKARAVGDITVPEYDAWAKQIRATCAPSYAKNILMVFSLIMDYAVSCGMRKTSPVVKIRRRGKYVPRKRERKTDLDLAVVHRLALNANELWGYTGYVFFLTIAFTGMRRAEIFGLRREYSSPTWPASDPRIDPDEEARYKADMLRYGTGEGRMPALRVEYQHKYIDGVPTLAMPKYGSRRTIVLPPFLAQMHEALLKSHDCEWTFPSVTGGPLLYAEWAGRYYGPIARGTEGRGGRFPLPAVPAVPEWLVPDGRGGVKPKRMHLLRHGHKEWLDEAGAARVAVEARMGHELPGIEGVYSHVTAVMEQRIMEVLQERWETFTAGLGTQWSPPSPIRLP
ncbi:MAG: integrase [Catenulispora sp.]|nr:integrase [Catenulispora sp.]